MGSIQTEVSVAHRPLIGTVTGGLSLATGEHDQATRLPDRVVPVRRRVEPDELAAFGMFDVVLALSVLHHLDRVVA